MNHIYSAPIDTPLSTAAHVKTFHGWDSLPRSRQHALRLSELTNDRAFYVIDDEGLVLSDYPEMV